MHKLLDMTAKCEYKWNCVFFVVKIRQYNRNGQKGNGQDTAAAAYEGSRSGIC